DPPWTGCRIACRFFRRQLAGRHQGFGRRHGRDIRMPGGGRQQAQGFGQFHVARGQFFHHRLWRRLRNRGGWRRHFRLQFLDGLVCNLFLGPVFRRRLNLGRRRSESRLIVPVYGRWLLGKQGSIHLVCDNRSRRGNHSGNFARWFHVLDRTLGFFLGLNRQGRGFDGWRCDLDHLCRQRRRSFNCFLLFLFLFRFRHFRHSRGSFHFGRCRCNLCRRSLNRIRFFRQRRSILNRSRAIEFRGQRAECIELFRRDVAWDIWNHRWLRLWRRWRRLYLERFASLRLGFPLAEIPESRRGREIISFWFWFRFFFLLLRRKTQAALPSGIEVGVTLRLLRYHPVFEPRDRSQQLAGFKR